jgi:hypothetical protein
MKILAKLYLPPGPHKTGEMHLFEDSMYAARDRVAASLALIDWMTEENWCVCSGALDAPRILHYRMKKGDDTAYFTLRNLDHVWEE